MAYLTSDQIAEKFSKGQECEFWLTRKQASWLLNQWQRETDAGSHFGRIQAKGEFENGNGCFIWTASQTKNGSALFKVWKCKEEKQSSEPINHPVHQYITKLGYTWSEVTSNPELLAKLTIEFTQETK
jgi:hypothetical protein